MDLNRRKEQVSIAYVRLVVALAGFKVTHEEVDDDSVDLTIAASGGVGRYSSPKIDVQLKCSARLQRRAGRVAFPLSRKNYDDLRRDTLLPRILVVLDVPTQPEDWYRCEGGHLELRQVAYWSSLLGCPSTENAESVLTYLPESQTFTPLSLRRMMESVERTRRICE